MMSSQKTPYALFFLLLLVASCAPLKQVTEKSAAEQVQEIYQVKRRSPSVKEGHYQYFFKGVMLSEGDYRNNEKHGSWKYYDVRGTLSFSGSYENDQKNGLWTYTSGTSRLSEIYYTKGRIDSANGYFENGNTAALVRYDQDGNGSTQLFYSNGKLKAYTPVSKKGIHGIDRLFFEDGTLHRELEYKDGYEWSMLLSRNSAGRDTTGGTLREGNGTLIQYFLPEKQTGKILSTRIKEEYKNGRLHGHGEFYNRNGKLDSEGNYENGERTGEWKTYKDGVLKHTIDYTKQSSSTSVVKKHEAGFFFSTRDYEEVEIKPEFPGGEQERVKFIVSNVRYPAKARNNGTEGSVMINFAVSPGGELQSFRIVKSVSKELDDEVIRLVRSMPRWNPGFQNGIPVKVSYNMPVKFKIQ